MATTTMPAQSQFKRSRTRQFSALPIKTLVHCLPPQGEWTLEEFDFFASKKTERPWLEFSQGRVVRKSVPLMIHVLIVAFLRRELELFIRSESRGHVFSEGAEFRFRGLMMRIPDVVFVSNENFAKRTEKGFPAIDLVMEVLSASNRQEDLVEKRRDYALGEIPEYWIIDPKLQTITVLKLAGSEYVNHGVFKPGQKATSALLAGFKVDVSTALKGDVGQTKN